MSIFFFWIFGSCINEVIKNENVRNENEKGDVRVGRTMDRNNIHYMTQRA